MIKRSALNEMAASKQKMMANVAMLEYYCQQICVKHETASLLPVVVEYEGEDKRLEEMAEVYFPEEHEDDLDKIYVVPNENIYLSAIIEAIYKVHPEFKIEIFSHGAEDESTDDSKKERMGDGFITREDPEDLSNKSNDEVESEDIKMYFIRLTMPPVTKKLRDTYHEIVENLFKGTKMMLDAERVKMKANVAPKTIGYTDKELKEVDAAMDEIYNDALKEAERIRKEKDEEIEWGYNRYVERHGEDSDEDSPMMTTSQAPQQSDAPEESSSSRSLFGSDSQPEDDGGDDEATQSMKL